MSAKAAANFRALCRIEELCEHALCEISDINPEGRAARRAFYKIAAVANQRACAIKRVETKLAKGGK